MEGSPRRLGHFAAESRRVRRRERKRKTLPSKEYDFVGQNGTIDLRGEVVVYCIDSFISLPNQHIIKNERIIEE